MTSAASVAGVMSAKLAYLQSKKVVVVDDAFDPPEVEDLDAADVADFIDACERDVTLRDEFAVVMGGESLARREITPDAVRRLWAARSAEHGVVFIAKTTLFADALDRLSDVTPFCDHLRKLGFDVVEVGQDGTIPAGNIGLVLVDYILGREATSGSLAEALDLKTDATERSQTVADRFYRQFTADSDRPFMVLMSSHPKGDVLVDRFREGAGLIGGLFDFISKKELCHLPTLEFKLRTWNYSLPARHDIQHFVEALSTAMSEITQAFRQSVMSLSFEDYAYIQGLALQEDGHPLGDYMLWLYSSQLSDLLLLHPQVAKQRIKLDGMELDLLPTQQPPSTNVAALYRAAVSLPVPGGAQAHPREEAEQRHAGAEMAPIAYLRLGHVFVNSAKRSVRMVLNAACDLAFAPHSRRTCDPDQSILFIPGLLVPLYEPIDNMSLPRTELFDVSGALYRVLWQVDKVFSRPHRAVATEMASEGYELTSQLRLPFALQVQQAFAAGLTRVGLPVPPPICMSVRVDLYCTDDLGAARLLAPTVSDGAFVVHRKGDKGFIKEFVLTPKTVEALLARAEELADQQLRVAAVTPQPGADEERIRADEAKRAARLQKRAEQVRAASSRHDFWFSLVSELRPVPGAKDKVEIETGFLRITCDTGLTGPWKGNPTIVINLLYGPEADQSRPAPPPPNAVEDAIFSEPSADAVVEGRFEGAATEASVPAIDDRSVEAEPAKAVPQEGSPIGDAATRHDTGEGQE